MLTVNTIPLEELRAGKRRSCLKRPLTRKVQLLCLLVTDVLPATTTILAEFKPLRRLLLVLGRHVVTLFAIGAL